MVYGICAGPSGKARRIAIPSIRAADPRGRVLVAHNAKSIFTAYNMLLERARAIPGADSMMLLHDDTQLVPGAWTAALPELLADQCVGLVGAVGGSDHPRMFWWQGRKSGGLEDNQKGRVQYSTGTHEVDTVDGLLLVLTGAAFRSVRFDQRTYGNAFHGYDADVSAQVKALGLRVVVTDMDVRHLNSIDRPLGDVDMLYICDAKYRLKWRLLPLPGRLRLRFRIARLSARRARRALRARIRP